MKTMTGRDLKSLRVAAGVLLAEMGKEVGVTESYLSKIESGARPITPDLDRRFREYLLAALRRHRATVSGLIDELSGTVR
jgi:transcriptional regulator with XRE-family HTH domain